MPCRGTNVVAFDPAEIRRLAPWSVLVDALRQMFATGCQAPPRQHYDIPVPGGETGSLLLMPAWRSGHYLGVKVVGVFPGNGALGKPTISGLFILADANTGEIVAHFDGAELTSRRTAAASALAASYLSRRDARRMVVIGTGRMARNLAQAYCAVRPIEEIRVYGRSIDKVKNLIDDLEFLPVQFNIATDLPAALREADIVTSATLTTEPIIHGGDLPDGIHVDLVGGFRPDMREADDDVIKLVSSVFVDTREGAFKEAGDIMQPIAAGILTEESVASDLAGLCRGEHPGRIHTAEITLFKSVGTAVEDLAAAVAVFQQFLSEPSTNGQFKLSEAPG